MRVSSVAKTIVAGIVALAGVVTPLIADDVLSIEDIVQMGLFLLGAFGVYVVPNGPQPARLHEDPVAGTEYRP